MNKSPFTNVLPNGTPKAKFKRHQVHEVVDTLTDARQIAKNYSDANRYPHRMTVTIAASPNLRPYDPIYLDGLPNKLSGYWTVLSVRHIFNGPYGDYIMEVHVGTAVLGDVNPNAGAASFQRNINSDLSNQNTIVSGSTLVDTSFATPVDGAAVSDISLTTTNVVAPTGMLMALGTPTTELTTTTTPDFSGVRKKIVWNSVPTKTTSVYAAPAPAIPVTDTTSVVPTLTGATVVVNTGNSYNAGTATVTVIPQTTGGSDITLYTVTTTPATSTFTSTTPEVLVTGLSAGTSYTFTAIATNAVGDSASVTTSSTAISTAPASPTLGTPTLTSATSISIPVTAGATGGSAITSYTVTSSPTVSNLVVTSGITSPLVVIGAFSVGTSYTLSVRAVNAYGTSAAATSSALTVTAATENIDIYMIMEAR